MIYLDAEVMVHVQCIYDCLKFQTLSNILSAPTSGLFPTSCPKKEVLFVRFKHNVT